MNAAEQFLHEAPKELINEMVLDFVARKRIAEAAKFKEPTDFNLQDNPNLRAQKPYPRVLYHWGRRTVQEVQNAAEHEAALAAGWKEGPPPPMADPDYVAANSGDAEGAEERFESLERRMQDMEAALGEILRRLPQPKKAEAVKP